LFLTLEAASQSYRPNLGSGLKWRETALGYRLQATAYF